MATGMKVWLGALLALCLLVAAWALPPSRITDRTRARSPDEVRFTEAAGELQRAHALLMAQRWSDSLSALVVETSVDGLALAYPPSEFVTPEGFEEWRLYMATRLDALPRRDPDMRVGFIFQSDLHGALEGVLNPSFGSRPQVYVGVRDGVPYCFVVNPERYAITDAGLRSARTLEQCEWYAKYGVPGNSIGAWLEAGGFTFAREARPEDLDLVLGQRSPDYLPFGLLRPLDESIVAAACLAGRVAACESVVSDPAVLAFRRTDQSLVEQSPMSHMSAGRFSPFQIASSFLLAEVEDAYGPEAFARFWKSNEPVPTAFRTAFGTELGPWVHEWADRHLGSYRASPAPRAASMGWSVLTVLLLSAFAGLKQVRRRVS